MESGSDAASSGAEAASDAAMSAKDMAREVAQVAVSTVGGVVVEAAQKAMKRRGKSGKNADQPASGVGASPARTGNAAPA